MDGFPPPTFARFPSTKTAPPWMFSTRPRFQPSAHRVRCSSCTAFVSRQCSGPPSSRRCVR